MGFLNDICNALTVYRALHLLQTTIFNHREKVLEALLFHRPNDLIPIALVPFTIEHYLQTNLPTDS